MANALQRRYVHGPGSDEPLTWYEGSGTSDRRFPLADERGSVVAITNGSGSVTSINAYDDYGVPATTNVGRFGYTGQTWLPEVGVNYYKARTYLPAIGRFMQTDPIGYGDGLNLYAYVGGDPVNGRDPSGTKVNDNYIRRKQDPCRMNPSSCDNEVGDIVVTARRPPSAITTQLRLQGGYGLGGVGTLPGLNNQDVETEIIVTAKLQQDESDTDPITVGSIIWTPFYPPCGPTCRKEQLERMKESERRLKEFCGSGDQAGNATDAANAAKDLARKGVSAAGKIAKKSGIGAVINKAFCVLKGQ